MKHNSINFQTLYSLILYDPETNLFNHPLLITLVYRIQKRNTQSTSMAVSYVFLGDEYVYGIRFNPSRLDVGSPEIFPL